MESTSKTPVSTNCMSTQINDISTASDQKTMMKVDGSSTPPEPKRHCPLSGIDMSNATTAGSSATILNSIMKSAGSSKPNYQPSDSSANSTKPHGKASVSENDGADFLLFADVTHGPHESELRFRLLHFWEAINPHTKTLIGLEMLLIDEKGTTIQGFIPANRVEAHVKHMRAGCVYRLSKFYGSKSKVIFRVADHSVTVMFSWNSVLSPLENSLVSFPEDRFQFHSHEEFEANCDLKRDLHDFIGHMKLVNGQLITGNPTLDEVDIAKKRHVLVHVQTRDEPVMKLYLWDKAATNFCRKFRSYRSTPTTLLVTTVNPKRLGGTLALTSMSSSRVFMQSDVKPTRDYLSWLNSNSDIANKVNADVVTKRETVTIADLFAYSKQDSAKVAWFELTATIDDVPHGSAWYYISCDGCSAKASQGPTSLVCNNKKCEKSQVTGVAQYLTKVSMYDKSDQANFVILGDAGRELIGKHASQLVAEYFEGNEIVGVNDVVPVPPALMDIIGQTRTFVVKVSDYNLSGKSQVFTVTKVLPPVTSGNAVKDGDDDKIGRAEGSLSSSDAYCG